MENKTVLFNTNFGDIKLEIFTATMPVTAGNFIKLVEQGFYNGVIFHRVIPDFMIQGGDPTGTGMGGPGYTIKDEFSAKNENLPYTISMANAGPNTGGSQFFINVANNFYLNDKHPVFGKVTEGEDVVNKIVNTPTGFADRPIDEVKIIKAEVVA